MAGEPRDLPPATTSIGPRSCCPTSNWTFIGIFGGVLVVWMGINSWLLVRHPFDPYPFILLNLVLSTIAAPASAGDHDEPEPAGREGLHAGESGLEV